jgi:hypothetical protein
VAGAPPTLKTFFSAPHNLDGSWSVTQGLIAIDVLDQYVFDGRGALDLGIGTGLNAVSQFITTTPGQQYTISFWANADSGNSISVLFDGVPVPGGPTTVNVGAAPGQWPGTWTQYTMTASTLSTTTALTLEGATVLPGEPGVFNQEIDDVSVTATPEPALAIPLAALVLCRRRRRARVAEVTAA